MTDRVNFLTVALESDMRSDDVARLIDVLRSLRGVADVEPHVTNTADYTARMQVAHRWTMTLYDVIGALRDGRAVTVDQKERR